MHLSNVGKNWFSIFYYIYSQSIISSCLKLQGERETLTNVVPLHRHIRNTKGAVQVEETSRSRGTTIRDPAHLDLQDPALTCLASPTTTRTAVNGYHSRVEEGMGVGMASGGGDGTSTARTQGIRTVKRRRLVRAGAGLCAGLRRGGGGGRIPAVQCKCVPPLTCVLCTRLQGVTPPPAPPDPCTQPPCERHARVDPTYHQVLSQPAGRLNCDPCTLCVRSESCGMTQWSARCVDVK